eukprot:NODE_1668_length_1450_cov_105.681656_g1507_i0.p1 GENE.NODE_1668_length_1450_cov_105.681656_g1507_i0~~NODE_1668_length_1450_cov_105.681656_g1507_i0.p1  ORF type:complete len:381 (+),score=61.85 NODE_1668_length_1450_cov_105.681656_g1507_i0:61-1203(+)
MNLKVSALPLLCLFCIVLADDPDRLRTGPEIIRSRGYPCIEHVVTTEDNYILTMWQIPSSGKPVLLQHGVMDSADTWVIDSRTESLGFILADKGYDVWFGNNRGTRYSLGHKKLKTDSSAYWAFTMDEMALYDVSAQVMYVRDRTNVSQIDYVGHSQGTFQMFANLGSSRTVARYINNFVAMAPVVYLGHCKSILIDALASADVDKVVHFIDRRAFFPENDFFQWLVPTLCKTSPALCNDVCYLLAGYDNKTLNATRWPVYGGHFPAGTSTLNMCHWAQAYRSDKFQMYDFGTTKNIEKYGQITPPLYSLDSISGVKITLLTGGKDDLGDTADVARLLAELPPWLLKHHQAWPNAAHIDFVWSPTAYQTFYPVVLAALQD